MFVTVSVLTGGFFKSHPGLGVRPSCSYLLSFEILSFDFSLAPIIDCTKVVPILGSLPKFPPVPEAWHYRLHCLSPKSSDFNGTHGDEYGLPQLQAETH